MLRKYSVLAISIVLLLSLLAACSGGNTNGNTSNDAGNNVNGNSNNSGQANEEPITINMFTASPEYTDAFNAYIEEYKKIKPNVTINLEIMQSDYNTVLKTRIASGSIPDVFQTTAGGDIDTYAEYSADLTDEPLAGVMNDNVRAAMTSAEGRVLGLAVKDNLMAMIANMDLLNDAGVTEIPQTLSELEDAIAKLEENGITPFANAYKEWWVWKHIFQHFVNAAAEDAGLTPQELVNQFIDGETTFQDHGVLYNNFFEFIDLTVQHGTDKPLERDSNAQIGDFGTGKAAFMTGKGAWDEETIKKITPDFNLAIGGYPVSDIAEQAKIATGPDQALRIHKDSPVVEETIEFFNWLYTSEYGQTWFSDVAKVIPPIEGATFPELDMPQQMQEIMASKGSGDLSINYSNDTFHQKFGELMQSYIGGGNTKDETIAEIQDAWKLFGRAH